MIQLRPYQAEAIQSVYDYFATHDGNPLIVLPTGTGKSLVLAGFIERAVREYPDVRILMVTHVRELIQQNAQAIFRLFPSCPLGIYSAGLGKRDIRAQVLCAGIQSIHRKAYDLQRVDLVIIDEAHLLGDSDSGMYRKLLGQLAEINPHLKIIGLTATPYRLKSGLLHEGEGSLFTDIAYQANILDMINQGYLAPVVPKATKQRFDLTGVGTVGGEFNAGQLERAVDVDPVTRAAVMEIVALGQDRRSWLAFCAGVDHAHHVRDAIRALGITAETVTGETPTAERDAILSAFKAGRVRCLTNNSVLTTGFDHPGVDLLAMLRPTQSKGLYCLDQETEILTSHGWKGMGEISVGDCALSADVGDGSGSWSLVTGSVMRPMEPAEKWVSYDAPRANFRVTGDHHMIYATATRNGFTPMRFGTALEMASFKHGIRMPTAVMVKAPGMPLTAAELYLIGMVMTDGSFTTHQVTIYQSERHPEIIARIEAALNDAGLAWAKARQHAPSNIPERHPRWRYSISMGDPRCGRPGKGFRYLAPFLDKDFSPALLSLSRAQFFALLRGINDGGGFKVEKCPSTDWTPRSWTLCSARKTTVDRLQALSIMHGCTAHVRHELGKRVNPIWYITITDQPWRNVGGCGDRPQIVISGATAETVWCIETEAGTIVTRRRGKVTVMGNCQIMGRATRPVYAAGYDLTTAEGRLAAIAAGPKAAGALCLDFAQNVARHGPIDMIDGRKPPPGGGGAAPVKECPDCSAIIFAGLMTCPHCGHEFPRPKIEDRITEEASTAPVLSSQARPEWVDVDDVSYTRHVSRSDGKPDTFCATYRCGMTWHREWVCFDHEPRGFPRIKAEQWWRRRMGAGDVPASVAAALIEAPRLPKPEAILVRPSGRYSEIVGVRFPAANASAA